MLVSQWYYALFYSFTTSLPSAVIYVRTIWSICNRNCRLAWFVTFKIKIIQMVSNFIIQSTVKRRCRLKWGAASIQFKLSIQHKLELLSALMAIVRWSSVWIHTDYIISSFNSTLYGVLPWRSTTNDTTN